MQIQCLTKCTIDNYNIYAHICTKVIKAESIFQNGIPSKQFLLINKANHYEAYMYFPTQFGKLLDLDCIVQFQNPEIAYQY